VNSIIKTSQPLSQIWTVRNIYGRLADRFQGWNACGIRINGNQNSIQNPDWNHGSRIGTVYAIVAE